MHFQFLTEDGSTAILIEHLMIKLKEKYRNIEITHDLKSFKGIGGLQKVGKPLDHRTGKLLNDLPMYLRAFNKKLASMEKAAIIVVLDNDKRDPVQFRTDLENLADNNMIYLDHVFGIAVKEMEAWLLGDMEAVKLAYPNTKINAWRGYEQDGICDTWEVLANAVYPGGVKKLKKRAGTRYSEIGKAKAEWADRIGEMLSLEKNVSQSFNKFLSELCWRIEAV